QTTQYETTFNTFPIQITEPIPSLIKHAYYDYVMGTMTTLVDYNAITTTAEYDVFGRITKLLRDGDTSAIPTKFINYYDWETPVRYLLGEQEKSSQSGAYRPTQYFY